MQAGHTYVKLFGAASPDLRLEATGDRRRTAIMGDRLKAGRAEFTARVLGGASTGQPRTLLVLRDGRPIQVVRVTSAAFTHRFMATQPGDYRIQVMPATAVDALTTPITLVAPARGASRPRG